MRTVKFTAALALAAFLVGCRSESPQGGPGALQEESVFTLSAPSDITVARGKREPVTFSIDRGDRFKQKVSLEIKAPAGVEVTPPDPVIQPGESEVKVLVGADGGAPMGARKVEVIGKPESGKHVSVTMTINVE